MTSVEQTPTHDVFISYSSKDDGIVRRRLKTLKAKGIEYWFAPESVPGGEDYAKFVVGAMTESKALLLMASKSAFESEEVLREVALASDQKIPVIPLLLEPKSDVPPSFRYRLALVQDISATDENGLWIQQLLDALRHYGIAVEKPSRTRTQIGSGLVPYLADRDTQEWIIQQTIEDHLRSRPHRPIFFVVHGEEAHCCDMFVERLSKYSIPSYLERILRSNQIESKLIRWPEHSNHTHTSELRRQAYCRNVINRLELPSNSQSPELMRYIGTLRRPVLFTSILGNETWQAYETELITGVMTWWSEVPDVPAPSQPVIILLSVSYAPYQPTLIHRFMRVQSQSPIAIQLLDLSLPEEHAICVKVLPELASLSLSDVEEWVRERISPDELDDVLFVLRAVFTGRRKDAEQRIRQMVRLKGNDTALDVLEGVFRTKNRSGRLPMEPLAPLLKQLLRAETVLRSI